MSRKRRGRKTTRKTDPHHFYHPKKLYASWENFTREMDYQLHHGYHTYFMRYCKHPSGRECQEGNCQFGFMCCYKGTNIPWGERVLP